MTRVHNFYAGPAVLPEAVLREAQQAIWELDGSGVGVLEISHRSKPFEAVVHSAEARLKRLMGLGDDHAILFLQGGGRTQFYMVPQNLLRGEGARATYLDTGVWADGAADEARLFGAVDVPFSSKAAGWDRVPTPGEWGPLPKGTRYLYYTSNNTVAGSEFSYLPDPEGALLVCDASSNLLSQPFDYARHDLLFGGAQKNVGPSGITIVVIKRALLETLPDDLPRMCRYGLHAREHSLYNTPSTFGIWLIERVAAWLEERGGLDAVGAANAARAARVYATLSRTGFWRLPVAPGSRSRMNVRFTAPTPELDRAFVAEAETAGLVGLKGHKKLGGLRASLYNALPDASVDALVDLLTDFEARHG